MNTDRLTHRKFTMNDLPRLIEMRLDPEVMEYIGGEEMQNPASLKKRLAYYISCYADRDLGMHAMLDRQTGEMIGWSGLQPLEDEGEIEVSYGMIKDYWGRGIGFETAAFWIDFGFRRAGLERIVAVADKDNTASWKIMEKLGMSHEKDGIHYGMDCVFYAISKEEFLLS